MGEWTGGMLAAALCKLEGFTYAPSVSMYWQHGRSTERDFIYVTTAKLGHEQLQQLGDEVGPRRLQPAGGEPPPKTARAGTAGAGPGIARPMLPPFTERESGMGRNAEYWRSNHDTER